MSKKPTVALLMGSDSDWDNVKSAVDIFDEFGIDYEVQVLSAHRTPDAAAEFSRDASKRGLKVIIAAAGGAAHLAGVLAAHTTLPVIGIPIKGGALNGIDALLATAQMPSGIPVATVTLGSAGAINAAVLAVQILATGEPGLRRKLTTYKRSLKKKVADGNIRIKKALGML